MPHARSHALQASAVPPGAERLRWGKYSRAYRKRLWEGCQSLQAFLSEAGLNTGVIMNEKSKIADEVLEQFVKYMREQEEASSLRIAKHAVLAVQVMRPRLKKHLQLTWNTLKAWEEQTPSSFRAPLPLALLLAVVCRAMLFSERASDHREELQWKVLGALTLLGFFGLLRPGELLGLRGIDAALPNSWLLGNDFAVLLLTQPKNSRQMGRQQYVEIRHPDAVNWLAWLKNVRSPEAAFWSGNANKFRSMFKKVCSSLGIQSLRLSPASLRRAMPSQQPESGEDLKQFKKVVVAAGPLKGARYPEVSWEDLRKAARSYKQDPRFNQYAKRMMSEKALGTGNPPPEEPVVPKTWKTKLSECFAWCLTRVKARIFLACFTALLLLLLFSRPLFYVVMAKSITMVVRMTIRRSFGFVVIILDAILDEAAANLEASLLTPPVAPNMPVHESSQNYEVRHYHSFGAMLAHVFFTCVGALLGRYIPRAHAPRAQAPEGVRVPTSLRIPRP
eukprot:Skav232953  [mRNA]  locus=scaffold1860:174681:176460:+ [translate_table: standard]